MGVGAGEALEKILRQVNTCNFTNKSPFFLSSCSQQASVFVTTTPSVGRAGAGLGGSRGPLLPEIIWVGSAKRWPRSKDTLSHATLLSQGVRMSRKALGSSSRPRRPWLHRRAGEDAGPPARAGVAGGVGVLAGPQEQAGSAGTPKGSAAQPRGQIPQQSHGRAPNTLQGEDPEPVQGWPSAASLALESLQAGCDR